MIFFGRLHAGAYPHLISDNVIYFSTSDSISMFERAEPENTRQSS